MDNQQLLNILFLTIGSLGGWWMKEIWGSVTRLRSDLAALNEKITRDYVRRDDYREDISEMKSMLARIFDKLDEKADK
jgi:hypothetical protein